MSRTGLRKLKAREKALEKWAVTKNRTSDEAGAFAAGFNMGWKSGKARSKELSHDQDQKTRQEERRRFAIFMKQGVGKILDKIKFNERTGNIELEMVEGEPTYVLTEGFKEELKTKKDFPERDKLLEAIVDTPEIKKAAKELKKLKEGESGGIASRKLVSEQSEGKRKSGGCASKRTSPPLPAAANSNFVGWQYLYDHRTKTRSGRAHYFRYNGRSLCGINLNKIMNTVFPMDYPLGFDHPTTDDCQSCVRIGKKKELKKK